jgi:hypothetical protein
MTLKLKRIKQFQNTKIQDSYKIDLTRESDK